MIGGGLLGLEAAGALQGLDVECMVVQSSDRLMSAQLDLAGGTILRRLIESKGIDVRTGTRTTRIDPDASGSVAALQFQDGSMQGTDVVIFTVGVRPQDSLARLADLAVHPNGGVLIDSRCRTADDDVLSDRRGRQLRRTLRRTRGPRIRHGGGGGHSDSRRRCHFPRLRRLVEVEALRVDVASFGDAFASTPNALDVVYTDPVNGVYKKLVLSDDAKTLLGGILVGDASAYGMLRPLVGAALGADPPPT